MRTLGLSHRQPWGRRRYGMLKLCLIHNLERICRDLIILLPHSDSSGLRPTAPESSTLPWSWPAMRQRAAPSLTWTRRTSQRITNLDSLLIHQEAPLVLADELEHNQGWFCISASSASLPFSSPFSSSFLPLPIFLPLPSFSYHLPTYFSLLSPLLTIPLSAPPPSCLGGDQCTGNAD